jgi:hypothetical protein
VNCTVVRDRLTEHALGVVAGREADALDRHLEWCAACRKEARDLRRAAAVLPYALDPAEPPADLEDRVVEAVRAEQRRGRPAVTAPRRSRLATVAALAAVLAVSGLGWGAVMAGRASRAEQNAADVAQQSQDALIRFTDIFGATTDFADADVELGLLVPTEAGGDASGTAATIVAPQADDTVLLIVDGLDAEAGAPYSVELRAGENETLVVGAIQPSAIATDGSAEFASMADDDFRRYDRVRVVDAAGAIVLRGLLDAQAPVPSPSTTP